ncbi:hypothetical protein D1AOALGA4SA_1377 [Olavius algarvensis Delta 1 endosymbiont]|nr:hypothetical protein D1AOALGA4SA_1377 [Olavius algarvensis Delta 1 endosymbiont]
MSLIFISAEYGISLKRIIDIEVRRNLLILTVVGSGVPGFKVYRFGFRSK